MFKKLVVAFIVVLGFVGGCKDDSGQKGLYGWVAGGPADGYGTILHTEDGGETWVRQGDSTMIPNVSLNDVSAVDQQNVWVVGENSGGYGTILRTTDGGETWVRQGSASSIPDVGLAVSAVNDKIAWVVGDNGVVLKTTDGGATWIQQAQGMLPNTSFQSVYAYDRNNVWAVGEDGGSSGSPVVINTTDGGATWVRQGESDLPDTCGLIGVHAASLSTAWVVGTGVAYLTTDGGSTWTDRSTPIAFYHNNGVCAVSEQITWVAADNGLACFTPNAGDTWYVQHTPNEGTYSMNLKVTAIGEDTVWMTSSSVGDVMGQIFHTTDGGNNWAEQFSSANVGLRGISFVGALR